MTKEPGGDALGLLEPRHHRRRIQPELQLLGAVDHDALNRPALGKRPEQRPPPAAEVLEPEQPNLPAPAEALGEGGGVGGDRLCAVEQPVPAVPPVPLAETLEVLRVDHLELAIALALEGVAIVPRLQRRPEGLRRGALRHQVAKQPVERADEVLRPLESPEHVAAELPEHAAEDHRALEVVAGLAAGAAQAGGELLEGAERRVEPAGHAALRGEPDQIVAQRPLPECQQVRRRGERLLRGSPEGL